MKICEDCTVSIVCHLRRPAHEIDKQGHRDESKLPSDSCRSSFGPSQFYDRKRATRAYYDYLGNTAFVGWLVLAIPDPVALATAEIVQPLTQ